MKGFVAPTDQDWYEFLRDRRVLDEVNFWRPSGKLFRLAPGTPFFFKLKHPHNKIAGFGYFARGAVLPAWLAWETFGEKNGAPSLPEMRRRVSRYRAHGPGTADDHIGCLMISSPVFFGPEAWVDQPSDWQRNIVSGRFYDLAVGEGATLLRECLWRGRATAEFPAPIAADAHQRYGDAALVTPRLGQGTFRVAVMDAYDRACAITTEHSLPVLEAAHIMPYAAGGSHEVRNGLLLRSDIHRLFDRGYVTVTPDLRFEVSARLKQDFANGRVYYALNGRAIHVPRSRGDQPDPTLLRWHNDNVFEAA